MAWSEPPFFAFMLSGLLVLAARVVYPSRRLLVLAATCLGLAMATRYVGITLFPALLFALWFMGERSRRDRVRDTLVAVPLALAPIGLWLFRNAMVSRGVTDRQFGWHPVGGAELAQLVDTIRDYLLPSPVGVFVTVTILVGLLILLIVLWRQSPLGAPPTDWHTGLARSLPSLLMFFVVTYVTFLLVSISVADANTPLDDRLLFPVFGCLVVAAMVIGERFVQLHSRHWSRWALLALVLLSLGLRAGPAEATVVRVFRDGTGYTSEEWLASPVIHRLRTLPARTLIYANESEAAGYLTSRKVVELPDSISWETTKPNPRYRSQMGVLCRLVNEGQAVVAYLTTAGVGDPDQQASVEKACPFGHVTHLPDGTIYSAGPLPSGAGSGGSD